MLREQFHAMITNADAANEADTDQLENLGFPIHRAKQYYLLAYRLQEQDLANEKDPDKIYEMQWFILQNVTRENLTSRSLENLCFREGGMQLYFIWTEKEDPEMLESILWSYEYCRSFLAQHFEFRYDIAVSSGHTGLDGVYKAYREVCRVYQYQQRTQDTGTIFYSDLKVQPGDTTVRYPVETENKLHLAVRSGDEGEACTQIQALMRQNQENYLSPAGMQFLVSKIMSTIVRAGEQRSDDPELAENQNRVMEAARRGSTEAMEQALCRLAGTVCQAVRASEQEAAADEKGRLYLEMRDYIEANYSDAALNVNALSEHFDRPAPFVSRYFKEMNGTNLTQYIHKVRLEHVKRDASHTMTYDYGGTGHIWDEGVITTPPTYDEYGEKTLQCKNCNATKTEKVLPTKYTFTVTVVLPTCTEDGYTMHKCNEDDSFSYKDNIVHSTGHRAAKRVIEPTCKEEGRTEIYCIVCGEVSSTFDVTPKKDHTWDDGVVTTKPTAEKEGVKTYTCKVCNETKTESIPRLNNSGK